MTMFKVHRCVYGTFVFLNDSTDYIYIPTEGGNSSEPLTQEQREIVESFLKSKRKKLDCSIEFPPPPDLTPELMEKIREEGEDLAKKARESTKKMRLLTPEDRLIRT